jgi:hypothetical protein
MTWTGPPRFQPAEETATGLAWQQGPLAPGQIVIPHGADRYLEADEVILGKLQ